MDRRGCFFRLTASTSRTTSTHPTTRVADGEAHAYPRWSPDGARFYFVNRTARTGNDFPLIAHDRRTGVDQELAHGNFGAFDLSADGRWIAITAGGVPSGAATAIVVVATDGSGTRRLLEAADGESFHVFSGLPWTPDSRAVIVRKQKPSELWLVPIDGGAPRKLDVDVRTWSPGAAGLATLSPDGKQLAFTSGGIKDEVWVLQNFLSDDASGNRSSGLRTPLSMR